jgi:hypothetical protein
MHPAHPEYGQLGKNAQTRRFARTSLKVSLLSSKRYQQSTIFTWTTNELAQEKDNEKDGWEG